MPTAPAQDDDPVLATHSSGVCRRQKRPILDFDPLQAPQEDDEDTVDRTIAVDGDAAGQDAPGSLVNMAIPMIQGLMTGAKAILEPCVAVVKDLPDPYGTFVALDALAPSTLASRFVSDRFDRLLQGDLTVILLLIMMAYNAMVMVKNMPWISFYNRYTIPLFGLLFVGATVLLTLLTDTFLSMAWMLTTMTCLIPLYIVLGIRAPNALLQWMTLIASACWMFNWNTFMLRSVLAIIAATPWIALPVIGIYTFATFWCFAKVKYGLAANRDKQITAAFFGASSAAITMHNVHWIGYSNSRWSVMSGTRGLLLPLALFLAHEAMSLKEDDSYVEVLIGAPTTLFRALRNVISLYATPVKLIEPILTHMSAKMVTSLPSKETVLRSLTKWAAAMDLALRAGTTTKAQISRPQNNVAAKSLAAGVMESQKRIQHELTNGL